MEGCFWWWWCLCLTENSLAKLEGRSRKLREQERRNGLGEFVSTGILVSSFSPGYARRITTGVDGFDAMLKLNSQFSFTISICNE